MEISKVCWGTMWGILTAEKLQNQFCWTNTAVNYQLCFVMCCDEGWTSNSRWKCQHWQWVAARGCGVTQELYYHLSVFGRQQKYIQALPHFCIWLKKKKKKEHDEHYILYEFVVRQLFLWNVYWNAFEIPDFQGKNSTSEMFLGAWCNCVRVEAKTENLSSYWGRRKQAAGQLKYLSWGEGTGQDCNEREVVRNLYILRKRKRTQQEYLPPWRLHGFQKNTGLTLKFLLTFFERLVCVVKMSKSEKLVTIKEKGEIK